MALKPEGTAKIDRRMGILTAAITTYADRGYNQTRVEDIAEQAGVSKGTIYLYFDSREAILTAAFDEFVKQIGVGVEAILSRDAPPLEKLKRLIRLSFEAARDNATLSRVLFDFWGASLHRAEQSPVDLLKLYDDYLALVTELLAEAERRGDVRRDRPALTPNIILAATDGLALHWMMNPELIPLEQVTDQLFDLLISGLQQ
jgi:TetR/AcrR family fatty acid metabolism transcriptional regulator